MRIETILLENLKDIEGLIDHYRFNDYRFYRWLPKDKLKEYLLQRITRLFSDNTKNRVVVAFDGGAIVGMATLNFLLWDTNHFGFNMAQLGYLIAEGEHAQSYNIKDLLISHISRYCRSEGIVHVSCRVDAEDISSVHALEKAGFRLADTLVKYVFNRRKHKVYEIKNLYKVRMFKDQDLPTLMEIARTAFSKDRFHLDSTFSQGKTDDFHAKWVENFCLGQYGERVFVAEGNNRPVGFLAFKFDKGLERLTGYKIGGHGLSAVSLKAKGAYPSLVKAAIQDIILNYDCLEFDTQVNNYEVLKVWQRFGFDSVRAQYTLHKNI